MKLKALLSLFLILFALQACQKATFKSVDKDGDASSQNSGKPDVAAGDQNPGTKAEDPVKIPADGSGDDQRPVLEVSTPVDQLKFGKETTTATATIKDSNEPPKVIWTVSTPDGKDPGTIDPKTGVYTSPEIGKGKYPVTITATLESDPSITGTKIITVHDGKPELIVTVPVAEIKVGGEKTTATARIKDDPNPPVVTWKVSGPAGKDIGTIDPKTGVYTSPKTGNEKITVDITATLDSDPSVTGTVPLIVVPVGMTKPELVVTVKDPEIKFGEKTQATATIKGGAATKDVTWTVAAANGKDAGKIDANGVYTAPSSGNESYPVIITATLKSDTTVSGMTTVGLKPAAQKLEVVVEAPEMKFGSNKNKATAKLNGTVLDPSKVTWSVAAPAGKDVGSIDANGVYTSPADGELKYVVTVTATLKSDTTLKASAPITLIPDDSIFVRCKKANTIFPIVAEVYSLAVDTAALPSDWSKQNHVTTVCMDQYNVPEREFTQGFPEVPNLFEWFGLNTKTTLVVPKAGVYTIRLVSDDGAKLWIGGVLIINNDGLHETLAKDMQVQFTAAGEYPLVLDYYQGPRYRITLELQWKKPGDAGFAIIPKESFK